MNGTWELGYLEESGSSPATPSALRDHPCSWITAQVPGNVELDLARAGVISAEPFQGMNILELRKFEAFQWWYRRDFSTPEWSEESKTEIVFEGLDCFATVWINDVEIGRSANALIAHRFDISSALAPRGQANRIVVRLASPIHAVKDFPIDADTPVALSRYESLWARKPPHAYGWDIMPRAVSAGLWRPIRLEEKRPTELTGVFLDTRMLRGKEAVLDCQVAFRTDLPLRDFAIHIFGRCGESIFEKEMPFFFNQGTFEIVVPDPQLWWPRGYGAAPLYDVCCTLLHRGQAVSEKRFKLGIRTVQLDRTDLHTPEQPGRFSFVVNGVPIFCRGTNWVPADVFHSRDAERIPRILDLLADMDCNMVRCWGGNVYEPHCFYDFCDREGILVWQDFSMAGAAYPQRAAFWEMIREEAERVVRELRQHPSLALWCGDNECDEFNLCWGHRRFDPDRNQITRRVLPEVTLLLDPRRSYMASSPFLSSATMAVSESNRIVPEQHLWGPRNYYKSDFYLQNTALFSSEMGYHGCPDASSLRRFISPEKLWPCVDNDEWYLHSTDSVPEYPQPLKRVRLMLTQIRELFGEIPDGLDHFATASQIVQAEAKKFFLELFRQRKGHTTGILWWNMMDGWPQMSDAIVDYYFRKKLAYGYLRRAHGPLTLVVHEPDPQHGGRLEISAVNDSLVERAGSFRIWDADSDKTLAEGSFAVGPNARSRCGVLENPGTEQRLFLFSWREGEKTGCGHYLYGKPPFAYLHYRNRWLPKIAGLDGTFDAKEVAR